MKLSSDTRRVITDNLKRYPLLKERLKILSQQYGVRTSRIFDDTWVSVQGSGNSDPVAASYAKMWADPDYREAYDVVVPIERTLPYLTEIEREIIELEFWSGEEVDVGSGARRLHINRRTYDRHKTSALKRFKDVIGEYRCLGKCVANVSQTCRK